MNFSKGLLNLAWRAAHTYLKQAARISALTSARALAPSSAESLVAFETSQLRKLITPKIVRSYSNEDSKQNGDTSTISEELLRVRQIAPQSETPSPITNPREALSAITKVKEGVSSSNDDVVAPTEEITRSEVGAVVQ